MKYLVTKTNPMSGEVRIVYAGTDKAAAQAACNSIVQQPNTKIRHYEFEKGSSMNLLIRQEGVEYSVSLVESGIDYSISVGESEV